MKISGQLAWIDYLKAQHLHLRPSRMGQIIQYALIGVFIVAVGFMVFAYPGTDLKWFWAILGYILFVAVLVALYYYVFFPRHVRQLFEQSKELAAPMEHEITPTGLITTSAYGCSERPWGIFRKWKEDKDLLMLYITDGQFIMIPKRFGTPEQLAALHARLDEYKVPQASQVRSGSWLRIAVWVIVAILLAILIYSGFRNTTP